MGSEEEIIRDFEHRHFRPSRPLKRTALPYVVDAARDIFGVSLEQMRGTNRNDPDIQGACTLAAWLAYTLTSASTQSIATYLGRKDHNTVIDQVKKMKARIQDQTYAQALSAIETRVLNNASSHWREID